MVMGCEVSVGRGVSRFLNVIILFLLKIHGIIANKTGR